MLTRIANETYFDFELYQRIMEARMERGLFTNSRPNHYRLLQLWHEAKLDAQLNAQLNNIEQSEQKLSKFKNFKK